MKKHITQINEFEEFIKQFDFFRGAQIDEDSIKSDGVEVDVSLLCPLDDSPENCEVYEKFLFFTLEKHAYVSVNLTFYNIKNCEIILNKDEHDEDLYINTTDIDKEAQSIKFLLEHEDIKHIKIDYTDFCVDISFDENKKTYAHKRLKFRPFETIKKLFP